MPKGGGWDETSSSYRYRVRDPGEFEEGSFRTIALGESGVKAVVGRLKGQTSTTIQALIFPKAEFTEEEAKAWVKEHAIKKDGWTREGRILKADAAKRYTLGVVYEPDVVDTQGDFATAEEIEKACWEFMRYLQGRSGVSKLALEALRSIVKAVEDGEDVILDLSELEELEKGAGGLGYMHQTWGEEIGDIVECYCAPATFKVGEETVRKGTWLIGVVWTPEYWEKVQSGEIAGFSMGGWAQRIPVPDEG